jgi:hypothetical protein
MDLSGNKTLYGKSLVLNQAAFVADFLTIVLGVQAPGHSYTEMDLNGNKTLYGKSLGSNQASFVPDFLTIVSGV